MKADEPSAGSDWSPGVLERGRALVRRLLVAILGERAEALAHLTYHRLLRASGRFGPPEDPDTMAMLRAIASRSRTIIDVGANVGRYAWFFRRHAPRDAELIALEPHPGAAWLLHRAIGAIPRCHVFEVAAADMDGTAELHVPGAAFDRPVSALSWLESGDSAQGGGVRVDLRRLDGLIADGVMPVLGPVFMKIDVEGSEARVLRGAAGLLRRYRPVIYFECQAAHLARQGETPDAVWQVLEEAGYRIFGKRPRGWSPMIKAEPNLVNYLGLPDRLAVADR